ncbi:MAG: putative metal-binding motif-containing protein [Alphaproteobacteria bacterium]|nr:putative metal-binding motif-containing protein [Alphaproteobacteria bacterium]
MRLLLLSLLSWTAVMSTAAQARNWNVPGDAPTVAAAVALAANSDTITLLNPDGNFVHRMDNPITINKNLTIRAEFPPREVDDEDIADDVVLWLDVLAASAVAGFKGAFVIQGNRTLTFENIRFKEQESLCNDRRDNDGNGLTDEIDPACLGLVFDSADPGAIGAFSGETRAFYVEQNGTLIIRNAELQGWSFGVEGNVLFARDANRITIENSRFISNLGLIEVSPLNGDLSRSRGAIHVRGSTLELFGNEFDTNQARYGGAVFATDGAIVVATDNTFRRCQAEDGGAMHIESSTLDASRNYFVENASNLTPGRRLFVGYEGGAIYAEDSAITLKNNVFLGNVSLDWGAAVVARRNFLGTSPPVLENNAFIENNSVLEGGASVMMIETAFEYRNNISFGEETGILGAQDWILGRVPTVRYNDFAGVNAEDIFVGDLAGVPVDQTTNLFADPLFAYYTPHSHYDSRLWDFRLDQLSPCIDSGDPDPVYNDVGGSRNDIGAFGGAQTGAVDADADGWINLYDCADDPSEIRPPGSPPANQIYPGALELCDGFDNDCNGIVDDRKRTWYTDLDFDGYGDSSIPAVEVCPEQALPPLPNGIYVTLSGDCDDSNALVNPGRTEYCDDIDNNCNGQVDENIIVRAHYVDADLDGFGNPDPRFVINVACPPEGFSPFSDDCNDADPNIHPLITVERRTHLPLAIAPLERNEADRNPDYVADGIDQDCDLVDLCYADLDRDGFGASTPAGAEPTYVEDNDRNCRNLSSFTAANDGDCDDGDPNSFPGGTEVPGDSLDQNCDGHDDCYEDLDGDGYGSLIVVADDDIDCNNDSSATSSRPLDCDDNPATGFELNPGAVEVCDGFDNNCDGVIDEVLGQGAQEFFVDADGDGYGDVSKKIRACGNPIGYSLVAGDCDDDEPRAFPGNDEVCDGIDNNCEAGIDENSATDIRRWYEDSDRDGYGNRAIYEESCEQPDNGGPWVAAGTVFDCDDTTNEVGPCCGGCSSLGPKGGLPFFVSFLSLALLRRRRED